MTLQFVFDDYIHHMLEHLRHMGVEVDDFAVQAEPCKLGPSFAKTVMQKPPCVAFFRINEHYEPFPGKLVILNGLYVS